MDENKSIFETEPDHIGIRMSAKDEWLRYNDSFKQADGLQALLDCHLQNVARLVAETGITELDGSVFMTDIPNTQLTVIDAHFPLLRIRDVNVVSRETANIISMELAQIAAAPKVLH